MRTLGLTKGQLFVTFSPRPWELGQERLSTPHPHSSPISQTRQRYPPRPHRHLGPSEVLIQIKDDLQRVPAPQIRQRRLGLLQPERRLRTSCYRRTLGLTPRHRQQFLQHLVRGQGETELRRRPQHTRGPAFEESAEAFFAVDGRGAVPEGGVFRLAFPSFDLQPGFDDIARGREVGGRHARDGARGQELDDPQLLGRAFAEEIALEVVVGREVDPGKGNIAEEAGAGAFVEADETKVADDPHGGAAGDVGVLGHFTLHLETDFDDFERIGEDLRNF